MSSVTETIVQLHRRDFTGKVTFKKDHVVKTIFFRKGEPIFVDSSVRSETLGQILLQDGKLTEEQYRKVVEQMKATGRRQGEITVEMGFLSAFEVYEALQTQAGRKIQNVMLLEGADVNVSEGEEHIQGVPDLPIDFFRIVVESVGASIFEDDRRELFPERKAPVITEEGRAYLSKKKLMPQESKVARLMDGTQVISRIFETEMGHEEDVTTMALVLRQFGFLQWSDASPEKAVPPQQASKPSPPTAAKEEKEAERKIVSIPSEKPESSPIYTWALKMDRPYHEVLQISVTANRFEVQRKYDSVLRELKLDAIDEHYSGKEAELATKLFERLTIAVTILTDPKRQRQYINSLAERRPVDVPSTKIMAEVCSQKAKLFTSKKKYEPAENEIRRAIELDPKESSYHVELAEILLHRAIAEKREERPEEIQKELKEALSLNSSDAGAFFQLGVLAKLDEDFERARGYFQRAAEHDPRNSKAAAELRLINRRMEEKGKAGSLLNLFKKK